MEAPVSSDSDEDLSDEPLCLLAEDFEDEVNINIHFHCEHCVKLSKCQERPKAGWSCEIIECCNGCGRKFHSCKSEEHELLCSHARVPCINAGNGCPHVIQRQMLSEHLPVCPASIVVCNAEWNRWALGARERERVSIPKEVAASYDCDDLDMALAIDDQRLVNDMHLQPKYLRKIMCNGMTKRFPSLPLSIRGSLREDSELSRDSRKLRSQSHSTTDEDEEGLTPGLSFSVCTELLRGKKGREKFQNSSPKTNKVVTGEPLLISSLSVDSDSLDAMNGAISKKKSDDISAFCCSHGIMKSCCNFCRNDPEEPEYKYGNVWKEKIDLNQPGLVSWTRESRIEKIRKRNPFGVFTYKPVDELNDEGSDDDEAPLCDGKAAKEERPSAAPFRFHTPPPAPLTPKGLTLEIGLKHYSRHQVKPKAMFTFHCMQEMRRDEFICHYKNVHSEIQEGLDGWLVERCPLHIIGCTFSQKRLYPRRLDGEVVFCHTLRSFGIKPHSKNYDNEIMSSHSRSPSVEKPGSRGHTSEPERSWSEESEAQFMTSSCHITFLPPEVLQSIARYLDGFSLNNFSVTCKLMREIAFSLLEEKGLVLQEWVRSSKEDGDGVSWKVGRNKWFFPKSFEFVRDWNFRDGEPMASHLTHCPFNDRSISDNKFCYSKFQKEDIQKFANASSRKQEEEEEEL